MQALAQLFDRYPNCVRNLSKQNPDVIVVSVPDEDRDDFERRMLEVIHQYSYYDPDARSLLR